MGPIGFVFKTAKSVRPDTRIQMARTMKKGSKIVTVIVDPRDQYFAEYPNEHYVV